MTKDTDARGVYPIAEIAANIVDDGCDITSAILQRLIRGIRTWAGSTVETLQNFLAGHAVESVDYCVVMIVALVPWRRCDVAVAGQPLDDRSILFRCTAVAVRHHDEWEAGSTVINGDTLVRPFGLHGP